MIHLVLLIVIQTLCAKPITHVEEPTQEKRMVVIHTFEGHSFHYNPAVHQVWQEETADGSMILSIRPKDDLKRPGTLLTGCK